MANLSRRQFLTRSSLAVAGAAAVAVTGPQAAQALPRLAGHAAPAASRRAAQPVVAYIRGGADGEITLMAGHKKIVRRDPDLVRRLLSAAD